MSGEVTGGYVFIWASYIIAGLTLGGLALWTFIRLTSAKRKLAMLDQQKHPETEDRLGAGRP